MNRQFVKLNRNSCKFICCSYLWHVKLKC